MLCEVKWGLLHGGAERYPETSTQLFCAGARVSEVNIMASGEGKSSSSAIGRDEKTAWRKDLPKATAATCAGEKTAAPAWFKLKSDSWNSGAVRGAVVFFLVLEKQLHGRVVNIWIDFPENIQPDQNPR